MKQVIFSRLELYELVWKEPIISLSRKYNVSDSGLRNICIKMSIPLPKVGHWEKLKWGKPVIIEELDETFNGEQNVTLLVRDEEGANINVYSPLAIRQKEIEDDSRLILAVPLKLTDPDKLIISARDSLNNKTHKDYSTGMLHTGKNEVNIKVSSEFVGRALRFMDTLIKGLRGRGHNVYINNWETCALIKGQEFKISFKEKAKRIPPKEKWGSSEFQPTGILYFKATRIVFQKDWLDGKVKIEDQLSNIIARMEIEGERRSAEIEHHHKQREEREEKERAQLEIVQRKEREIADYKEVLQEAQKWHQTNLLRSYLESIEESCIVNNTLH